MASAIATGELLNKDDDVNAEECSEGFDCERPEHNGAILRKESVDPAKNNDEEDFESQLKEGVNLAVI
jgi:hypothetical protein